MGQKGMHAVLLGPAVAVALGAAFGLRFGEVLAKEAFFVSISLVVLLFGLLVLCKKDGTSSFISYRRFRYGKWAYGVGWLALFFLSFLNGAHAVPKNRSELPEGVYVRLCLHVLDEPQRRNKYHLILCRLPFFEDSTGKVIPANENVQVFILNKSMGADSLRADSLFAPGTTFFTRAKCFTISSFSSKDSSARTFDYASYMFRNGTYKKAYVYSYFRTVDRPTWPDRLRRLQKTIRNVWEHPNAEGMVPASEALLSGICLGYKAGLNPEIKQAFSKSGASHILAVSGLHVGVLYGAVVLLLGLVFPGNALRWARTLPALALIWTYALMIGLSASVVRASFMLTWYGLGTLWGKRQVGLNAWAGTALVLLVINPTHWLDAGFQLSFCAVGSLLLFFPLVRNIFSPKTSVGNYLWELICCSLVAQWGTLWLSAGMFGMMPLYGLLTNLVAVPLSGIILYAFIGFLFLWGIQWIGIPMDGLLAVIIQMLEGAARLLNAFNSTLASLPYSAIPVKPDFFFYLIYLWGTGYLIILLWIRQKKEYEI